MSLPQERLLGIQGTSRIHPFIKAVAVFGITVFLLYCLGVSFFKIQPWMAELDHKANIQFDNKARELSLVGRNREFVIRHFGKPYSTKRGNSEYEEVLLFYPGPTLAIWKSCCLVVIDKRSNTVLSWGVNSD